jgi:hypothetical protein
MKEEDPVDCAMLLPEARRLLCSGIRYCRCVMQIDAASAVTGRMAFCAEALHFVDF